MMGPLSERRIVVDRLHLQGNRSLMADRPHEKKIGYTRLGVVAHGFLGATGTECRIGKLLKISSDLN
jgi:hypothetical protein